MSRTLRILEHYICLGCSQMGVHDEDCDIHRGIPVRLAARALPLSPEGKAGLSGMGGLPVVRVSGY